MPTVEDEPIASTLTGAFADCPTQCAQRPAEQVADRALGAAIRRQRWRRRGEHESSVRPQPPFPVRQPMGRHTKHHGRKPKTHPRNDI